jgi:HEAT repeat protein
MKLFEPDIHKMRSTKDIKGLARLLDSEKHGFDAAYALGQIGIQSVEPLLEAIKNRRSYFVRRNAAYGLGILKDERAIEPLIIAIQSDSSWSVREYAITAIRNFKDSRALEPILMALRDPRYTVRAAAVEALSDIKDPKVEPALFAAYKDPSNSVRVRVIRALGWMGHDSSLSVIFEGLKDPDSYVRSTSVGILSKYFPSIALEHVMAAINDPELSVRYSVVNALAEIGDEPAKKALIALACNSPDIKVRNEALECLKKKGWQAPITELVRPIHIHYGGLGEPYCSDDCFRRGAAFALTDIAVGQCKVCGNRVWTKYGEREYAVIPYEGGMLVVCKRCVYQIREKMKTYKKCSICQRDLSV